VPPSVAWIYVAPVKGLALLQPNEVEVGPNGVVGDRRFHLIGEDGRMLNLKLLAPIVQVVPLWNEEDRFLSLVFPDRTTVAGEIELGETVSTNFYGRRDVEGRVVEGPWAEALSSFVGRPLRLVQPVDPFAGRDRARAAVSLLSTGSLEALRRAAGIDDPVDPRRFRMLFGVEGLGPHEEDTWIDRHIRIGGAEIRVCGNVGRCIVTSRNPETGARTLPTLDVIAEYRNGVETTEALPFGVWGEVTQPGRVRLGDPVEPIG
jgi:uncharacterized protein YcbX